MDKYSVLISWHHDGHTPGWFRTPVEVEAESFKEAAEIRINKLADPSRYDDVIVLSNTFDKYGTSGMVFPVRDFLPGRKPRYGWCG